MRHKAGRLPLVLLLMFFFVRPAAAYIDPGTGSFLLQALLGILFGLLYTLKIYWSHVRAFFRRGSSREQPVKKREE